YLEYLYSNGNHTGIQKEWWCHVKGCGTWFIIERDTRTNLQVSSGDVK
ncbi:MAG: sarcosine oxidase subunit delta, partial [Deltaproteobacteria bacterium]